MNFDPDNPRPESMPPQRHFIITERGPEKFVPLKKGTVIRSSDRAEWKFCPYCGKDFPHKTDDGPEMFCPVGGRIP